MPEPAVPPTFELERFELIVVAPHQALLRVSGHWKDLLECSAGPAELLLRQGGSTRVLGALPDPSHAGAATGRRREGWHAAFAIAPKMLGPAVTFALRRAGVPEVELPAPRNRSLRPSKAGRAVTVPDREVTVLRGELLRLRARMSALEAGRQRAGRALEAVELLEQRAGGLAAAIEAADAPAEPASVRKDLERGAIRVDELERRIALLRDRLDGRSTS